MMLLWLILKKIKNKRNGVLNPFFYIINCKINPEVTPIKYINAEIIRFCFIFLLVLNNTINPTPAPVSNPATKEIRSGGKDPAGENQGDDLTNPVYCVKV